MTVYSHLGDTIFWLNILLQITLWQFWLNGDDVYVVSLYNSTPNLALASFH